MYSKVIYFEGIFLSDIKNMEMKYKGRTAAKFPEDLYEKTISFVDYIAQYNEKYGKYNRIPSYFITIDSWPKATNLRCWNCSLPFSKMPWFIPNGVCKQIIDGEENNSLIVYGNFCSPNCTINYIMKTNDQNIVSKDTSKSLLYELYEKVTGLTNVINPYPSYTLLRHFRGPSGMSPVDYRRHFSINI